MRKKSSQAERADCSSAPPLPLRPGSPREPPPGRPRRASPEQPAACGHPQHLLGRCQRLPRAQPLAAPRLSPLSPGRRRAAAAPSSPGLPLPPGVPRQSAALEQELRCSGHPQPLSAACRLHRTKTKVQKPLVIHASDCCGCHKDGGSPDFRSEYQLARLRAEGTWKLEDTWGSTERGSQLPHAYTQTRRRGVKHSSGERGHFKPTGDTPRELPTSAK